MASLLDRLIGEPYLVRTVFDPQDPTFHHEDKIPVHQFMALLIEAKRNPFGQTAAQRLDFIAEAFDLSTAQRAQLTEFATNFVSGSAFDRQELHDVLMLAEGGIYTKQNVKTRLSLIND